MTDLRHVPPTITAIVAELPKAGSPMHRLRKQAFLRALSAMMNFYYPDKEGKP